MDIADTVHYLRSPQAIRERCQRILSLAVADQLAYFRCDLSQVGKVADYVIRVTRQHYPQLDIPFHSRWRHLEVGNGSCLQAFRQAIQPLSVLDQATAQWDWVIISVLLDAGSGSGWAYVDPEDGQCYRRSEGLAVASWQMFRQGLFSDDPATPLQVTAQGLANLTLEKLAQGFQVSPENPLAGVEGRWQLLQHLGQALRRQPELFGSESPRPGHLITYLLKTGTKIPAERILAAVLTGLGEIWPGRIQLGGVNLGDVWQHSALAGTDPGANLVPFHKLSQWLTYSLLEPLQDLGVEIENLDALTGLPEYRNGGLCLDLGLLTLKQPEMLQQVHQPGSEVIVEWRALTVALLDAMAVEMRLRLGMTDLELPLAKVLQGGTWAAGRQIAAELRPGGIPPLQIASDGTVF